MARLKTYVNARRNEAEDHIWSLREDPSYFHGVLLDWADHRQENLLTAKGKSHPVLRQDIFWERVIGNVIVNAYIDLVAWDVVAKEIDNIEDLRRRQCVQNKPGSRLPVQFAQALVHFQYLLEQLTKGPISDWKAAMEASPPLRQHYVRETQDPNSTRIAVTAKVESRRKSDHLLWLLEVFLQDDQLFLCGLENVCDELEREIRSNQSSKARITPYIASLISDMSLLGELKRQIDLSTPGPRILELIDPKESHAEFSKKIKLMSQIVDTLTNIGKGLADVATPLGKFNFPSDKRRTLATTQRMQQAERNLDMFWAQFDEACLKKAGQTVHTMLGKVLNERHVERTPDWEEPIPEESGDKKTEDITSASSRLATLELQERTEKTIVMTSPIQEKHKPKTRGVAQATAPGSTEATQEQDNHRSTIFRVSKRGFKVFKTLYFTPTEGEPPGEIAWSEFLSAMASVGFSIKKLDGSAWVFAPSDDEWRQSIIFHEPHPSSKIPFQVARRFGRRLWRRYGWTGESFQRA